jgi:hypothetical protein
MVRKQIKPREAPSESGIKRKVEYLDSKGHPRNAYYVSAVQKKYVWKKTKAPARKVLTEEEKKEKRNKAAKLKRKKTVQSNKAVEREMRKLARIRL